MSVVLIGIAAFTVDLGQQRVARRDMQALADMVALDMSRLVDGTSKATIEGRASWAATRAESIARNSTTFGDDPEVTVTLGSLNRETGAFTAFTDGEDARVPNAVEVSATTSVGFSFLGGSGRAVRTAVGTNRKSACFQLGSYAAALDTDNSLLAPLNQLIGADLQLLSYQGLTNADISITEVGTELGVGGVDQLLNGSVTTGQFYAATIAALQMEGGNEAAITALQLLQAQVNLAEPFRLGDLVAIDPDADAALTTDLNLLDLIAGSALIADGQHAVSLPDLKASIPAVAAVHSTLNVIQKASMACDDEAATQSQLVGAVGVDLKLPDLGLFKVTGGATLNVNLGNARGNLTTPGPSCNAGTLVDPDELNVALATALSTLSLSAPLHLVATIATGLPLVGNIRIAFDVNLSTSQPMPPASEIVPLKIPPNDEVPKSVGAQVLLPAIAAPIAINLSVTNPGGVLPLATVLNLVSGLVNSTLSTTLGLVSNTILPIVTNLANSLYTEIIKPLTDLLGINVAGADVLAIKRPNCGAPELRG